MLYCEVVSGFPDSDDLVNPDSRFPDSAFSYKPAPTGSNWLQVPRGDYSIQYISEMYHSMSHTYFTIYSYKYTYIYIYIDSYAHVLRASYCQ